MNMKEKILSAWIMEEHLTEGDVKLKDTAQYKRIYEPLEQGLYSFFMEEMYKGKISEKGGIVLYFDIFPFEKVVKYLKNTFRLKDSVESIPSSHKFRFALYFDRNLNFLEEKFFFTASAYILWEKKIPTEEEFKKKETEHRLFFKQKFQELPEGIEDKAKEFHQLMSSFIGQYGGFENCRYTLLKNRESDIVNLHSFFVEDLEKAKKISFSNLEAYLYGGSAEKRINLDSNNKSKEYNPQIFEDILSPKNYPLGRFPSNIKYALSFMQQVAVNLTMLEDKQKMRSVNGPPGTGKTTLLRDVFAALIVRQAYDIAKNKRGKITWSEDTIYTQYGGKSIGIGKLPISLAKDSIIVASSNNAAVQNIVNKTPLKEELDPSLQSVLDKADYFQEIANTNYKKEYFQGEDGKKHAHIIVDSVQKDSAWGLFSMEGGKAENVAIILLKLEKLCQSLKELERKENVYEDFLSLYQQIEGIKTKAEQNFSLLKLYQEKKKQFERERQNFQRNNQEKNTCLSLEKEEKGNSIVILQDELKKLEHQQKRIVERIEKKKEEIEYQKTIQASVQAGKPGFFTMLFSPSLRKEYDNKLQEITDYLLAMNQSWISLEQELRDSRKNQEESEKRIHVLEGIIKTRDEEYTTWLEEEKAMITRKERELEGYRVSIQSLKNPLDFSVSYEKLQLSDFWFDESFRELQSRLFILALEVRKQFLIENRGNILAAKNIFEKQNEYIQKKHLIREAWNWINMVIPVIGTTFASLSRMLKNIDENQLGFLFVDEAGQAIPQAAVGGIFRARKVLVVGDPAQIEPVLPLDSSIMNLLREHYQVDKKYIAEESSVQCLVDAGSIHGYWKGDEDSERKWIGIPLWVHRRCNDPMFSISNALSYQGNMVQGILKDNIGTAEWFDVKGKAIDNYVNEQGEFLKNKLQQMIQENPEIVNPQKPDQVYIISPFRNVSKKLADILKDIGFTRYGDNRQATNVGTIHTFQGKEANTVFLVLGADEQSKGAARWAVSKENMMNVAASRAKKEFYIIGDKDLYQSIGTETVQKTMRIIEQFSEGVSSHE